MMRVQKITCPSGDFSCPYCHKHGECGINHPVEDCDDFLAYYEREQDAYEKGKRIYFDEQRC